MRPRRESLPGPSPSRRAPERTLVVDGFSLLHRDAEAVAMLHAGRLYPARRRVVALVERALGPLADRAVVVFDGRGEGGPAEDFLDAAAEVLYAPSGTTADLVIERWVRGHPRPDSVLVVTSDRMERESVDAAGARHMGCGDFLEMLRQARPRTAFRRAPASRLGDGCPGLDALDLPSGPSSRGAS